MSPACRRVMLVAPPGRCTPGGSFHAVPPEGTARLAAWIRQHGHEVAVVDVLIEGYDLRVNEGRTVRYGLSAQRAASKIAEWSPEVIGLSCLFTCTEPDVLEIARACRARMPEALMVMGGAHAALNARALLEKEPALDCVALGEGEAALASLLESGNPAEVDGFAHRLDDGSARFRPLKRYLPLDRLPLPAWDLLPLEAYARANAPHYGMGSGKRYLTTSWSRGCVHACSFCLSPKLWGPGNHRKRPVADILDEAGGLVEQFGIEELHVEDDCLLDDRQWFHGILDEIARRLPGLRLDFSNGLDANQVNRPTAERLARAGTVRLALSFEAGEPSPGQKWTDKRVPLQKGREAVAALHDGGIDLVGFFMLGFPGQTIDDMNATVEYALSLDLDAVSLFIATPFPGTPLHTYCEREGLLVQPCDYRDFRFCTGLIRTPEFGPGDTERIRREGWEEFHRRRRGSG
jgi:anaerobic magnesium-protoporphyrin IX monomethyl ester cyclase